MIKNTLKLEHESGGCPLIYVGMVAPAGDSYGIKS